LFSANISSKLEFSTATRCNA